MIDYDITGDSKPDWIITFDNTITRCSNVYIVDIMELELLYDSTLVEEDNFTNKVESIYDHTGDGLHDILVSSFPCQEAKSITLRLLRYEDQQLQNSFLMRDYINHNEGISINLRKSDYSLEPKIIDGERYLEIYVPYIVDTLEGPISPSITVYKSNGRQLVFQFAYVPMSTGIGYVELQRANQAFNEEQYLEAHLLYQSIVDGKTMTGEIFVATGWQNDPNLELMAIREFAGMRMILTGYLLEQQKVNNIAGEISLQYVKSRFPNSPYLSAVSAMVESFKAGMTSEQSCEAFREIITDRNITYPLNNMGSANMPLTWENACPF